MLIMILEEKSAASHKFRSKFEISNGEVHESHFRNPAHNRMSKSWNPNLQNRITIIIITLVIIVTRVSHTCNPNVNLALVSAWTNYFLEGILFRTKIGEQVPRLHLFGL